MAGVTHWVPVGLADQFPAGSAHGIRIDGQDYVLWRDANGAAHVWDDRCPHRGMRMSLGFVRGDQLACLYHGWQYGKDGRCTHIPAHPNLEVPANIAITTYPCLERMGMVWAAPQGEIQEGGAEESDVTPVRSLFIQAPTTFVLASLAVQPLPSITPGEPRETDFVAESSTCWRMSNGLDHLIIGCQRLTEDETALHIVIDGSPSIYRGAGLLHISQWAERLRGRIEDESAANGMNNHHKAGSSAG